MDDFGKMVGVARKALSEPYLLSEAERLVPSKPGLYAIYGSAGTWRLLGLGDPHDNWPLYVGKAEDSLKSRDLETHFGNGRTGSSTLRRSFAALLHDSLGFCGIPRNPAKPDHFSNYGLSPAHDAALTLWMRERLELAFWAKPEDCYVLLKKIESQLPVDLSPPLNLKDVATLWTARVKAARKVMAAEARAWAWA